ncbi:MAG: DUF3307 domain-containing protein [Patescibacteria group bacterium]
MNIEQLIITSSIFVPAFLGHCIGDYLLQSKWMALTKTSRGATGMIACTIHVLLYATAVCAMIQVFDWRVWLAVAIPHWIIDRFSIADKWLRIIRGRTPEGAARLGDLHREFHIAFWALVYTAVDNMLHLLCLWFTTLIMFT